MVNLPLLSQRTLQKNLQYVYLCAILLITLALIIFSPWIVPYDPELIAGPSALPPQRDYWFGTDSIGLDVFSRTIVAARFDVSVAILVAIMSTIVGLVVGMTVGMNEARTDLLGTAARGIARGVDLSDAIPVLIVGVIVAGLIGSSIVSLGVALTIILSPNQIRLTRTEVLRVRKDAFLDAARMAGLSEQHILLKHVLPNSCLPALHNMSVVFGTSIITLAALGFLGVGLPPPTPEWGAMISAGVSDILLGRWWTAVFPAVALCLAVACGSTITSFVAKSSQRGIRLS